MDATGLIRKPPISRLDFHRFSPFRGPAYRWELAVELAQPRQRLRPDERDVLGEPVRYLRALNKATSIHGQSKVHRCFPELSIAHAIHVKSGIVRDELEARLLARQTSEAIAAVMNLPFCVVARYAYYFFDLPPSGLDWIFCCVLRVHEWLNRKLTEGDNWRFMALAGGPVLVDLLVDDFLGRPAADPEQRHMHAELARFRVRHYVSCLRSPKPTHEYMMDLQRHGAQLFSRKSNALEDRQFWADFDMLRIIAGTSPRSQPGAAADAKAVVSREPASAVAAGPVTTPGAPGSPMAASAAATAALGKPVSGYRPPNAADARTSLVNAVIAECNKQFQEILNVPSN